MKLLATFLLFTLMTWPAVFAAKPTGAANLKSIHKPVTPKHVEAVAKLGPNPRFYTANFAQSQKGEPGKLSFIQRLLNVPEDTVRTVRNLFRIIIQTILRILSDSGWGIQASLEQLIELLKDIKDDLFGNRHVVEPLVPYWPPPRVTQNRKPSLTFAHVA